MNLKHKDGLKVVQDLIEKADILVENYVPGKLNELGLGYEECKKLNPRLIYASITGAVDFPRPFEPSFTNARSRVRSNWTIFEKSRVRYRHPI